MAWSKMTRAQIPAVQTAMAAAYPNAEPTDGVVCNPNGAPYPSLNDMETADHDWAIYTDGRTIKILLAINTQGMLCGLWGYADWLSKVIEPGGDVVEWVVAEYGKCSTRLPADTIVRFFNQATDDHFDRGVEAQLKAAGTNTVTFEVTRNRDGTRITTVTR